MKTFLRKQLTSIPFIRNVFEYYHFHSQVRKALQDSYRVLDLGCGTYNYANPKTNQKKFYSVGIDIFQESIDESKALGLHDEYKLMNVMDIDTAFEKNYFDTVVALDLIEHLTKENSEQLLNKMEHIARKVIIFTPNGFVPQVEHYGNPFQVHLCGWTAQEMKQRGYNVIGFGGLKWFRSETFDLRFKPTWFWWILSDISQIFARNRPEKAFSILCIKNNLSQIK